MRRGGTLHPPRPRAPAATRQAPPFLPNEGQVFHTGSCDLKDQGFGEVQGLPRKERNLGKKGGRRQTVPWDQQRWRSCEEFEELKELGQRRGKEPQPQAQVAF